MQSEAVKEMIEMEMIVKAEQSVIQQELHIVLANLVHTPLVVR